MTGFRQWLLIVLVLVPLGGQAEGIWAESGLSAEEPRVRQTVMLHVDLFDDRSIISKEAEDLEVPGLHLQFLGSTRREARIEGERYVVHRYRWEVMPLAAGDFTIQPPAIAFRQMGGATEGSPVTPPAQELQVRPLPAHLPVYLPVSRLEVRSSEVSGAEMAGRPGVWRIEIAGPGLDERGLRRVLDQQLEAAGLRFYDPSVDLIGRSEEDRLERRLQVRIPFVARQGGDLRLPDLRLPFVEPETARLAHQVVLGPAIEVRGPLAVWGQRIGLGLLAVGLVAGVGWLGYRQWQRLRCRRRMGHAETPEALRRAILEQCPEAAGARTLGEVGRGLPSADARREWLERLERLCYAGEADGADFQAIRRALVRGR